MKQLATILKSLRDGAGELSPSCREAARLQSEALDHRLRLRQRMGLRIHLLLCKWCRRYGKQIDFLRSAAHQHDKHEHSLPAQKLRPAVVEQIKQRLNAEEK